MTDTTSERAAFEAPEGWVLVPREVTIAMHATMRSCEGSGFSTQETWDYILAAAPTHSAQAEKKEM